MPHQKSDLHSTFKHPATISTARETNSQAKLSTIDFHGLQFSIRIVGRTANDPALTKRSNSLSQGEVFKKDLRKQCNTEGTLPKRYCANNQDTPFNPAKPPAVSHKKNNI